MKRFVIGLMILWAGLASLRALAKDKVDYTHCNPRMMSMYGGYAGYLYQFSPDGGFSKELRDVADSFKEAKNGQIQEMTFRSGVMTGYGMPGRPSMKYVLEKGADGRPVAVETYFGAVKANKDVMPENAMGGVRFAYAEGKCYVAQSFMKGLEGKDLIQYDHALCNEVLGAVKKKAQECSAGFKEIEKSIAKAAERINNDKQELAKWGSRMEGAGSHDLNLGMIGNWEVVSTINQCNAIRGMYGMPVDKDTSLSLGYPGMPGFGGGFSNGVRQGDPSGDIKSDTTDAK